ncbi:Glucooligosaccharide oxidase [Atractiella rhizophila]|nr:Glucooligosaccharide oxidase [Atractiella rhizophila]
MVSFKSIALSASFAAAVSAESLADCLTADSNLEVFTPSSADWETVITPFNKRLLNTFIPAALVKPANAEGVSTAVKCAAAAGVHVSPRSGGHSYAAAGLGMRNGSLVVDTSRMNHVSVDSNGVATAGTGTLLGDYALTIGLEGWAMAHGTCPTVGIGGHVGYGGYGLDSRLWGLALDHVIEAETVLASGEIVTVNKDTNPDLFWAIRGSAVSFGITTQYKFQTHPAPETSIEFIYAYTPDNVDQWNDLFLKYQDFGINSTPSELTIEANIGRGATFNLVGQWIGDAATLNATMKPFLDAAGQPDSITFIEDDWLGVLLSLAGSTSLNTSLIQHPSDTFYVKSLTIPEATPITLEASTAFYNHITQAPSDELDWFTQFQLYGGKGSKINTFSTEDSAYPHRSTLWTVQIYASSANFLPPYPQQGFEFTAGEAAALVDNIPNNEIGGYLNYIDPYLDNWQELYFSEQYDRLLSLEKIYDPTGIFVKPQIVGNLTDVAPDI